MKTKNYNVVSTKSNIDWIGKKVTGAHNGTIAIKTGTLVVENGRLLGGNFTIDTTAIKILDITDPATNDQFAGHLFSADFFATENFPEASFIITNARITNNGQYLINGDLTIKGITHPISFSADVVITDEVVISSGKMLVDRTKYDMKFRSGNFFSNLGDTLIYNEFELDVKLTATATL